MQTDAKDPNWWHRRTVLERCLTIISLVGWIVVIGLIVGLLLVVLTNQKAGNNREKELPPGTTQYVCHSEECVHTASAVLDKMKTEIKPCDDFFRFACGNYIDKTKISDDQSRVDTFSAIRDTLSEQLTDIIAEERHETDHKHIRLPNILYRACMNTSLIESLGTKPITQISDAVGGWPVIVGNYWDNDNTWTWQDTVKKFRRVGLSTNQIIDLSISVDLKNSTKRIIELDQPSLGLSRKYLVKGFNETLVSAYYDYMVDIAVLFGAKKEAARKELRESLEFEIDLAKISWPSEKRRDSNALYNLRTINQMQATYPYIQWLHYINALLPAGVKVDENEVINLAVPSFFDDLGKLFQRTQKRTIANYMMWRIHASSVAFLTEEFRKRQLQYANVLQGTKEQTARWKECVNVVSDSLGILSGAMYVRKHFQEDSKAIALEMVDNIRSAFSEILDEAAWMDNDTRKVAKRKLYAMTTHIGYPSELLDDNKLEELYRELEIDDNRYYESHLKINIFVTDYSFNQLRLPVNKTDWTTHAHPAVVNAFYSPTENSIQFPAGILQGHFFNAQRPKYMNYGAIGYVIGHEITHGFDDEGRQFDLDGNLIDWWQSDTKKAYLEKAKCIIEQYGNYTDKQTGLNLNGINTQGENIADNGGIKESYIAYRQWVNENGEEATLPGLNYTPYQMFWISAAQNWCAKYRTESLKMRIITGVHSPSEFRVLGPFKNMIDFSHDFQCPEGSPMNPVHKCEVW